MDKLIFGDKSSSKIGKNKSSKQEEASKEEIGCYPGFEQVKVRRVIDGDTFEITDGRRIRLVGINAPESTNRIERFGKEANNYTTSVLLGKHVWMQKRCF